MKYLTTAIIIIVVSLLMRYLQTFSRKKPDFHEDGTMVLKFPGFIAAIGYVGIGFGVLIGIVTFFNLIKTTGDEVVPYLVLFFAVLGLPLVLIANGIRVLVTDQKVQYVGITNKIKEIRWDEIRKVTFSFTSELILQSELTKIKLNMELVGFENHLFHYIDWLYFHGIFPLEYCH